MKEIDCIISGKVQMVMFRDFVLKNANALSLRGYVENREDRTVHVVAQGGEQELNTLIEKLHRGPFNARVARVDVTWRDPTEEYDRFTVLY
jgi:acylphosphatase